MSSARFKQVAGALSQGIGLYAGKKAEDERRQAEEDWQMALEDLREGRYQAREERAATERQADRETATTRYEADVAHRTETATLTAADREATRQQGESHFVRGEAFKEDQALYKRLATLDDRAADELELGREMMDPDIESKVQAKYGPLRDQAIASHVVRMASDKKPGYKKIDSLEALSTKMITLGMDADGADLFAGEMWERISGEAPAPEGQPLFGANDSQIGMSYKNFMQPVADSNRIAAEAPARLAAVSATQPGASTAAASVPPRSTMPADPMTPLYERPGQQDPIGDWWKGLPKPPGEVYDWSKHR